MIIGIVAGYYASEWNNNQLKNVKTSQKKRSLTSNSQKEVIIQPISLDSTQNYISKKLVISTPLSS